MCKDEDATQQKDKSLLYHKASLPLLAAAGEGEEGEEEEPVRTRKKGTGEHTCEQDTRAAKTQTPGKIKTWIELSTHLSLRRLAVVRLHSQLGPGATNLEEER